MLGIRAVIQNGAVEIRADQKIRQRGKDDSITGFTQTDRLFIVIALQRGTNQIGSGLNRLPLRGGP